MKVLRISKYYRFKGKITHSQASLMLLQEIEEFADNMYVNQKIKYNLRTLFLHELYFLGHNLYIEISLKIKENNYYEISIENVESIREDDNENGLKYFIRNFFNNYANHISDWDELYTTIKRLQNECNK